MKIKREQPAVGTRRERKGFLWLPRIIGEETRWLERARWQERYVRWADVLPSSPVVGALLGCCWITEKWLNDDQTSEERC